MSIQRRIKRLEEAGTGKTDQATEPAAIFMIPDNGRGDVKGENSRIRFYTPEEDGDRSV